MKFVTNFQDPASILSYDIISFHHDIMFFIFIILSLVYWTLYKIVKDSNHFSFNKLVGFCRYYYYTEIFIRIYAVIAYLWMRVFSRTLLLLTFYVDIATYFYIREAIIDGDDFYSLRVFASSLNEAFLTGYTSEDKSILDKEDVIKLVIDKCISYFTFSKSSEGSFYYDSVDSYLSVNRFKHSTSAEYLFAGFPTFIILSLLLPSLFLLYSLDDKIDPMYTLKVTGHQWYWSFDNQISSKQNVFLEESNAFDMILIPENELQFGQRRLLSTDNSLFLERGLTYRFLITSADVLHSFALPALGIKIDAIPGRLNQFIVTPKRIGDFFGQCSEICGTGHGFMPIHVKIISLEDKIVVENLIKT